MYRIKLVKRARARGTNDVQDMGMWVNDRDRKVGDKKKTKQARGGNRSEQEDEK